MSFLSCNTVNIYYEIHGQGKPLLFIHGLGSSTFDWEAQIHHFSKNYKVIVFDLRGHGQSGKASAYSIPLFTDDVACLIRELEIQPANVVGISLGGMIGMHLAVYYPGLVKSLTVVNSPSEFPKKTPKSFFQILLRFFIIKVMGMSWMGKVLAGRLFPEPEQKEIRDEMAERWSQNDPKSYWKSTKALLHWSITDHLDKIKCHTLIVGGEFDYFPVKDKELLASRIKNAKLSIIKNSRHGTPLDQKEVFNNTLEDFLETVNQHSSDV